MAYQKTPRENTTSEIKPSSNPAAQPNGFADESQPEWAPPEFQPEQISNEPVMKPADTSTSLTNSPSPT